MSSETLRWGLSAGFVLAVHAGILVSVLALNTPPPPAELPGPVLIDLAPLPAAPPPAPEPEPVPCPHRPAAVVYAPVQKLVRPHGHVQKPPRRFNWNRHKPHRPSRLSGSRHTVAI